MPPRQKQRTPPSLTHTFNSKRERNVLLMEHYSSAFTRPSKYLLLSRTDEETNHVQAEDDFISSHQEETKYGGLVGKFNDEHEEKAQVSNAAEARPTKSLLDIGEDCLMIIGEYMQVYEMNACIRACKNWGRLLIPSFMDKSLDVYVNEDHLIDLELYGKKFEDENIWEFLFTEAGTWKDHLCHPEYEPPFVGYPEEEETIDNQEVSVSWTKIPFGSPLCKGTISEQYELIQDETDVETYKEMVKEQLGIPVEEQRGYEFNPFYFYNEIVREKHMVFPYIKEVQQSLAVHNDDDYDELTNEQRTTPIMTFFGLRYGIHKLLKRAGVSHFEPDFMEDAFYMLKRLIYLLIKDAYETKFPNKTEPLTFKEPIEQYSKYYRDLPDFNEPCFDDEIDADLKISATDIVKSVEKLLGKKFYYASSVDPYLVRTNQQSVGETLDSSGSIQTYLHDHPAIPQMVDFYGYVRSVNCTGPKSPEDFPSSPRLTTFEFEVVNPNENSDSSSDEQEDEQIRGNEYNLSKNTSEVKDELVNQDSFIDDSEVFTFDLDNLGDLLHEQLMKVSIQVHEEVYGKERAHEEKLYLKNWYGNNPNFFVNCSTNLENPEQRIQTNSENSSEIRLKEKDQIEIDMKEDLDYFGYSLYEDDFNEFPIFSEMDDSDSDSEQATEEESLQYQVRRMLRERSYECIVNYYK